MAAMVAAAVAIQGTLAVPGALDSQPIIIIRIDRTPVIRGVLTILIPLTTIGKLLLLATSQLEHL
jgi:hypothetical protein